MNLTANVDERIFYKCLQAYFINIIPHKYIHSSKLKLFSMRDFNRVNTKELKAVITFIKNISLLHKTNYACGLVKNIYREKKEKRND